MLRLLVAALAMLTPMQIVRNELAVSKALITSEDTTPHARIREYARFEHLQRVMHEYGGGSSVVLFPNETQTQ